MAKLQDDQRVVAGLGVERQLVLFTALWAVAHLAHLLRKGDPTSPLVWAVFIAALLLLERPASSRRLGVLATVQLAYLYMNLPSTDNHLVIMGFVNLGLLAAVLLGRRGSGDDTAHPAAAALPYVRLAVLLAYGAAALAKLNRGFFDPAESCAVSMFHDALAVADGRLPLPAIPPAVESALPFVVAATELAIPLLLLIPATRLAGVGVVVVFHLLMSLSPSATAIDFTIVLFALVSLFLPTRAAERIVSRWHGLTSARREQLEGARPVVFILLSGALAALIATHAFGATTVSGNRNWVVLAVAAIVLGAVLVESAWHAWREGWPRNSPIWPAGTSSAALRAAHLACVLLLLANAASPYLGGKTKSVFTMYSNLQTEAGESNHYLFPRLPVETGQDDLVLILESSNRSLNRLGAREELISWHELRRTLSNDPGASVAYQRGSIVHAHDHAHEDAELVTRDRFGHRFISHRTYNSERALCLW